mmetsp:Transcript_13790/g.23523  ORF Transcript_13790/g.23523 Transcript_13790/m.23523 type:complete len:90 (+) Transcript_13790:986-1255(+)
MHRVADIGRERYSCPFFFCVKHSARIELDVLKSGKELCEDYASDVSPSEGGKEVEPFGVFLCKSMTNSFGEWKNFQIPHIHFDYSKKPK